MDGAIQNRNIRLRKVSTQIDDCDYERVIPATEDELTAMTRSLALLPSRRALTYIFKNSISWEQDIAVGLDRKG